MKKWTLEDLVEGLAFEYDSYLHDDPVRFVTIYMDEVSDFKLGLLDIDRFKMLIEQDEEVVEFLNETVSLKFLGHYSYLKLGGKLGHINDVEIKGE